MPSRLTHALRCLRGTALVRWTTVALCSASLLGNLTFHGLERPLPAWALALQALAVAATLSLLHRRARSINLMPAELADRMLKVQESERQHLSRELHDDIGQSLTAAKLQLEWLQRRVPADLQPHCATLRSTLTDTLANVRDVSAILNPRQLSSLGLEASLRAHLLRSLENGSVHWSLDCQQRLGGISESMTMAAFRIVQEAVTNMLRHARAQNLWIRLQRTSAGLALSIQDDGVGFVPAVSPAEAGQRGMAGMLERATALNGSLTVTSQPGAGTRIDALLPWPARQHERAGASNGDD